MRHPGLIAVLALLLAAVANAQAPAPLRFPNVGMDAAYHIKESSPDLVPVTYKRFTLNHTPAGHAH